VKALVTRPREDCAALVAHLTARGIASVLEPMLEIRFAADGANVLAPHLDGAQAVLFTSANGVRAFANASQRRDLPAFAVGDASAAAARAAGFGTVESAHGAVAELAALVRRLLSPERGALVHAAASAVAGDLAGTLGAAGFAVRRAVLYEAVPAAALSGATAAMLAEGRVELAVFFSPRTAASFVRLARASGLNAACRAIAALALSPAVAAALEAMPWRAVRIAAAPTEAALLAVLDRAVAEGVAVTGTGQDRTA
jgi:uroporphyrinogen-III synthase